MFRGVPRFRFPDGFRRSACVVLLPSPFLSVCPIHIHFLFLTSGLTSCQFCQPDLSNEPQVTPNILKSCSEKLQRWPSNLWLTLFISCHWCIAVSRNCSLGSPLSHGSPVLLFLDRRYPCFWNIYTTISVDVLRE